MSFTSIVPSRMGRERSYPRGRDWRIPRSAEINFMKLTTDIPSMPETVEVGLFYALQEALENGHRHA